MIEDEATLGKTPRHELALAAISAGIRAAQPRRVVPQRVSVTGERLVIGDCAYDLAEYDSVAVLGGGNGAGQLAAALETVLGERVDGGVVVTDDPAETDRITVHEGTHPLPSAENRAGTTAVLDRATSLGEDDLGLVVVTGGASALLCHPAAGLSVEAYRELTATLIESGARIDQINVVRKHLSRIKGGRLAAALTPASVCTLVISDVTNNRLDVIGSGPTTPDPTTYEDARAVLDAHGIDPPERVTSLLSAGAHGWRQETPTADSGVFDRVRSQILADNRTALNGAAAVCERKGYTPLILSARIEGEASEAGTVHAGIAAECAATGTPLEPPAALLSGGETTVTVTGDGSGGPNQEFALGAGVALEAPDAVVAAVDTDGRDGPTDAAGALVDHETVADGSTARARLRDNDAYGYLDDHDAVIRTGQTGTNVNDLRVVLVGPSP